MEKGRNCSLGAISPLIHNILLPGVRFLPLKKDQIFSSRQAVIRGESTVIKHSCFHDAFVDNTRSCGRPAAYRMTPLGRWCSTRFVQSTAGQRS